MVWQFLFFCFLFFSQCQCYFRFRHYPGVKKTIVLFFVTHTLILIVFNDKFCLHCLKVIFLLNNSHRFLPSFRARPNWETHAKRLFYSIVYRDFTSRKTFALFFLLFTMSSWFHSVEFSPHSLRLKFCFQFLAKILAVRQKCSRKISLSKIAFNWILRTVDVSECSQTSQNLSCLLVGTERLF